MASFWQQSGSRAINAQYMLTSVQNTCIETPSTIRTSMPAVRGCPYEAAYAHES